MATLLATQTMRFATPWAQSSRARKPRRSRKSGAAWKTRLTGGGDINRGRDSCAGTCMSDAREPNATTARFTSRPKGHRKSRARMRGQSAWESAARSIRCSPYPGKTGRMNAIGCADRSFIPTSDRANRAPSRRERSRSRGHEREVVLLGRCGRLGARAAPRDGFVDGLRQRADGGAVVHPPAHHRPSIPAPRSSRHGRDRSSSSAATSPARAWRCVPLAPR